MTMSGRIRDYLAATLGNAELIASVGEEESLIDRGLLDSLGAFEMAAWLHTEFGVTVDEVELTADNFGTIAAVARYIQRKTATTSVAESR